MKNFFGVLTFLLIAYIIFFDLKHGTLPTVKEQQTTVMAKEKVNINFFEGKVKAGDTVLTIVENRLKAPIPVSIDKVVSDFVQLNKGVKPEKIQVGKTYRFPEY